MTTSPERTGLSKALSLYSAYGWRGRIGLVSPSTNTTLEPEFWRLAPEGVSVHTARIYQAGPQEPSTYRRMADDVATAATLLATAEVDVIAFGCTSCTYFVPPEEIRTTMAEKAHCPTVLTADAVVDALKELNVRKIALASPRTEFVTQKELKFLADSGFDVVAARSLGLGATEEERRYIGRVPSETLYRLALSVDRPEAEALFITCTQLPTLPMIERLEAQLGKPVISSNQATLWRCLRHLGYTLPIKGYGRLLDPKAAGRVTRLRILSEDDVRAAIDTDRALDLARRTLKDQAAGGSLLATPPTMSLDAKPQGGSSFKFRAATVGHLGVSGIRLISRRTPTGPGASEYSAIYRHEGTAIAGLVSESWLSRIRTAAFGAAVFEHLVNPGPLVVALFGTGRISDEMVYMLDRTLQVSQVRVQSRRAESMAKFVAQHSPKVSFQLRTEHDARRMVEGADLVITLTESPDPLVFPQALKPGVVVCSMGSYNELDFGVLRASQRFIVDDPEYASSWGDGGAWIAQGRLTRDQFMARIDALACDVVAGKKPGRTSPTERIVALVQGMAIGDIAFAAHALNEAEKSGRGTLVELP